MKNKYLAAIIAVVMTVTMVFCGCQNQGTKTVNEPVSETQETVNTDTQDTESQDPASQDPAADISEASSEDDPGCSGKQVVVYFANWNLDSKDADKGGEVASIPWESVTYINHAFWEVVPADGSTEDSFERRAAGEPARESFTIVSTFAEADYEDETPSAVVEGISRNHFAEYEYFHSLYPEVNIMISLGGWSDSGFFSEMAYTESGRETFTQACVDLMKEYPWIGGIDIDWEYPGGNNDGERYPEDESDEGCPIWGTAAEDRENFALLCETMKSAFAAEFGEGVKKLTACASASTGYTLPNQDWSLAEPYLDMINIMTYDLAGLWDGSTGLASSGNGAKTAILYFKVNGVPLSKCCIGSPMYATVWKMTEKALKGLGAQAEDEAPNEYEIDADTYLEWEAEAVSGYTKVFENGVWKKGEDFNEEKTGWHVKYNGPQNGTFMYNDEEGSQYYRWFLCYENEVSLQAKLDLIRDYDLAGIIVWESSEDTSDHRLIRQMGDWLK